MGPRASKLGIPISLRKSTASVFYCLLNYALYVLRALSPPRLFSNPRAFLSHLFSRYTPQERLGLQRTAWFLSDGQGYLQQQSTQPQTLGYSLSDSPIGLLAWIYEKLVTWTDAYQWEDDEGGRTALPSKYASNDVFGQCSHGSLSTGSPVLGRPRRSAFIMRSSKPEDFWRRLALRSLWVFLISQRSFFQRPERQSSFLPLKFV